MKQPSAHNEVNPNLAFTPSAPAPSQVPCQDTLQKLQGVLNRFEISIAEASDLVLLQDYDIVIIADDSGSMQNASDPPQQRVLGQPTRTRWQELKETVSEMIDIAVCFDLNGVDVHFLNRPPIMGAKGSSDPRFMQAFQAGPQGGTPLTETLLRVAQSNAGERPLLLFILTDGEPNNGKEAFIKALRHVVSPHSKGKVRVQIMACTAEVGEIGWLNALDHELKEVDVTDDYHAEKEEVLRAGLAPRFTRGDWCMKAMLGPVSHKFDKWDEHLHQRSKVATCGCALI